MTKTPQLDVVLKRAHDFGYTDRRDALMAISAIIDKHALFQACRHWGVLVNDSAEEFALQFYTAFNNEIYTRY